MPKLNWKEYEVQSSIGASFQEPGKFKVARRGQEVFMAYKLGKSDYCPLHLRYIPNCPPRCLTILNEAEALYWKDFSQAGGLRATVEDQIGYKCMTPVRLESYFRLAIRDRVEALTKELEKYKAITI